MSRGAKMHLAESIHGSLGLPQEIDPALKWMVDMLVPLYGFLQGDTSGLLILAHDTDSIETLAKKLASAARVRVPIRESMQVRFQGKRLSPDLTVAQAGLSELERFDLVEEIPS